jgi:glycosyltransferase involved in cell wall biosynthesis
MKIVYLMDQCYLHGGAEKILTLKINALIENYKHEVILVTTEQKSNNIIYPLNKSCRLVDLAINYNREKSYFQTVNLFKAIKHYFKLNAFLKNSNPDCIISVSNSPDQYFVPFLVKNIPIIKEFHSSGINSEQPKSFFEKCKHRLFLLLNRYSIKVVLNEDEKKYYPFESIVVIPNFISIQNIDTTPKENIIIAAGRIAQVKQFDDLISAWSMIADEVQNWEIHIYGEGNEVLTQKLQNQISQLQVPRIELKGATNQLHKKMLGASIYAMTSATECFPMVLLEAQAAGMAVISYDCPNGPRNIITHNKNVILVKDQNIKEFAVELKKLIQNTTKQKELQIQAQQNINQFSEDAVMKMWDVLFKKLKR